MALPWLQVSAGNAHLVVQQIHVKQQEVATFVVCERCCFLGGGFLGVVVDATRLDVRGSQSFEGLLVSASNRKKNTKVAPNERSKLQNIQPHSGSGTYCTWVRYLHVGTGRYQ